MTLTQQNIKLRVHQYYHGGAKTVCVSTCLNYLGISPDRYHYTSSNGNVAAYKNVLRRFGYSVRSRKSEFRIKNSPTMTDLRKKLRKSQYTSKDLFLVHGYQSKKAHLMILNGNGETVIDTSLGSKWRVLDISIVEKII